MTTTLILDSILAVVVPLLAWATGTVVYLAGLQEGREQRRQARRSLGREVERLNTGGASE
jgi:hypothetical protein